ncbi:glycoside hydrolase family 2 protein [Paenibacillus agricola]|uniref:Glycoside hydrolase family 2 n=1 Tax=Paenibacillus agricola TaxID=2716264 RepID=A0ABX0JCF0_9BACL|nr:sugar-binding domain-containing protein [Paenibacillus agricola]NHN33055.1 glycoside hydrolase family 2 [Paenibacillus agricola]
MMSLSNTHLPRPEYPRPDWQRTDWLNLNGEWAFGFDTDNRGVADQWFQCATDTLDTRALADTVASDLFNRTITVPFSWASPLSGIGENTKGIGWYRRAVQWDSQAEDARLFLRFGAVDYHCTVWVNEIAVGSHIGGYGTFELEVTGAWKRNQDNLIVIRVEDQDEEHQTRGKQGYGEIRGMWQTVWLEARPQQYVDHVQFITELDGRIVVKGVIQAATAVEATLHFDFSSGAVDGTASGTQAGAPYSAAAETRSVSHTVKLVLTEGMQFFSTEFQVDNPLLWSPESPHLYEGTITLEAAGRNTQGDRIETYFGIRTVGTFQQEGLKSRWITLNDKPIFLNGTLDQSFHPTGFFTYPTDGEMHDEIYRLKRLGLNFVRIHIKPEEPRKLYWADKLGMLVMEDMPCFWGTPDEQSTNAYKPEALETIQRDWNHPSIISWVIFNESWGLLHKIDDGTGKPVSTYLPETQAWVKEVYEWAKVLDPTRLIEDNSPCRYDHVKSDLNTWHFYLNGYQLVRDHIETAASSTYPGSTWNYIDGHQQSDAPLMNSECGAVWGIDGSAGDSDLGWQYRYMLNEFRRHENICGFIFTEFKDVVNEFNGYYRIDDTEKDFGYGGFCEGMSLRDLHQPDFIVIDAPPCTTVTGGQSVSVPIAISSFADTYHGQSMQLSWELWYDHLGVKTIAAQGILPISWNQYGTTVLAPLSMYMPEFDAVAVLAVELKDPSQASCNAVARNFITFDVRSETKQGLFALEGQWLQSAPASFSEQQWEYAWQALQGSKVNGSGAKGGFFEYEIDISSLTAGNPFGDLDLFFEAGSKILLSKDQQQIDNPHSTDLSYMHGRKADPGMNVNSYYMTDEHKHPSTFHVYIDGTLVDQRQLADDPADSQGVLSWHYQTNDRLLDEAGSYGYLQHIRIPSRLAPAIIARGSFRLRLEVPANLPDGSGGLCLYGRNAGRYPIDILVRYI